MIPFPKEGKEILRTTVRFMKEESAMKRQTKVFLGLVLIVALIITSIYANAASNTIPEEEIDAIINTTTDASQVTRPFIQVSNQVRNSLVGVNNYTNASNSYYYYYGFGGRNNQPREALAATGSGVVVTNYGHVLTNYHVVEDANRVTVTTAMDESEHEAQVVGFDAKLDIAVLYVPGLDLPAVPLGDSDQLQVGEWAIVIGNPLGEDFARTMTVGVVSALDRQVSDSSTDRYGRRTTITNTMIQVDAAINSGNSGGGMFNTLGQLQGIPARKYSSSGLFSASIDNIGMCIPINVAKPLLAQVLRDYAGEPDAPANDTPEQPQDNTMIGKPRLGVTVTTLNSSSNVIPLGAFVREVEAGSPAEAGGIKPGDIIVEVDGTIVTSSSDMVSKLNGGYKEGDTIAIKVYRDEALAKQATQNSFDMSEVGNGDYVDLSVTLRIIDNVTM